MKNKLRLFFKRISSVHAIDIFVLALLVFSSIVGAVLSTMTADYKLDRMSYQLVDYNRVPGNSKYDPAIFRISKNENKIISDDSPLYNDLYNNFYYNILYNN